LAERRKSESKLVKSAGVGAQESRLTRMSKGLILFATVELASEQISIRSLLDGGKNFRFQCFFLKLNRFLKFLPSKEALASHLICIVM
jgi:hypothetical protein